MGRTTRVPRPRQIAGARFGIRRTRRPPRIGGGLIVGSSEVRYRASASARASLATPLRASVVVSEPVKPALVGWILALALGAWPGLQRVWSRSPATRSP